MRLPRGTLLNTATVIVGSLIGLAIRGWLDPAYQQIALGGIGLLTLGIGIKLFLGSKNILIVAMSIALGGMIGYALGITNGIGHFAEWAKGAFGGQHVGTFAEGLITTSILFCVGPMTLLGCMQDGLEGKIDLLALKSTMDGVSSIFFAAALGHGVLVSALVVLVVQGALTLGAQALRPVVDDEELLAEVSATGGVILLGIGLGLLDIKKLPTADYLPALALAPLFVWIWRRIAKLKAT